MTNFEHFSSKALKKLVINSFFSEECSHRECSNKCSLFSHRVLCSSDDLTLTSNLTLTLFRFCSWFNFQHEEHQQQLAKSTAVEDLTKKFCADFFLVVNDRTHQQ